MSDSDDADIAGVILLRGEPEQQIFLKWLSWILIMVLFVIILIWVSRSKPSKCAVLHDSPSI